ncbi:DinB family protein [Schlesneria sp. DSM 10557]|uniref:DinB family protein n=1 Tax=Schlesneria sp. DSM 10557 TaxID=3044399 RepID=UPI00359FFCCF
MALRQLIQTQSAGDIMVLELASSVSSLADHNILNELDEIREQRRCMGCSKLIVDLAEAPFFGSSLLELIRVLWNDISRQGGRLVICNPSPVGREVLEVAKFHQIWPIMESREEAFIALSVPPNVASWPDSLKDLVARYERGAGELSAAVAGFPSMQLKTPAPPGVWSVLQIVCHLSDFEIVYADRMKRVVAEDNPTMLSGDPDLFAAKLAYDQRDVREELGLIASVRRQVARILRTLKASDFDRTGQHSTDGPISLLVLLQRVTGHITHHLKFIEGKAEALRGAESAGLRV